MTSYGVDVVAGFRLQALSFFSGITSALELGLETTLELTARSLSLVAGFEFSMGLRIVAFVWDADSCGVDDDRWRARTNDPGGMGERWFTISIARDSR
jgi:hypothetical protein